MQIELKRLQNQTGITFIFVTHDQEEALSMSDRIAVMEHGRVLQIADPKTLYDQPNSRAVADFIGTANFLPGRVIDASTVETALGRMEIPRRGDLAPGARIIAAIRPEKFTLSRQAAAPSGRIAAAAYLGDRSQFQVSINGATVIVAAQNSAVFRIGEAVHLAWEAAAVMLFPE